MNYRIDHLAFRTLDRAKAVKFLEEIQGYVEACQFNIDFNEKDKALCSVMVPGDRTKVDFLLPWTTLANAMGVNQNYVLSPEIFISEGTEGSIVYNWAKSHGGAGLHHIALQVAEDTTVEEEMKKWIEKGWCEGFTSEEPFRCDEMSQVFTKPSSVFGVIFELIKRKEAGFCQASVQKLMESTKGLDHRI